MTYLIIQPSRVHVGGGSRRKIAELLAADGIRRPLLVTDAYLERTGVAGELVESMRAGGLDPACFAETVPDPTTASLEAGVRAVRAHRADGLVALGGGSPIDTAKALGLLALQDGPMRRYKAPRVVTDRALPVFAVPTTAGSGSEVTQFSVITDSESDEKMLCAGPSFLPRGAIIDYELTLTMPPRLTADTGIDALTHAVESYVSAKATPFSSAMSLAAVTTIGRHLRPVFEDGENHLHREAMMWAATQAGIAFSNASVALVHGMSRPLGARFGLAHGLSNAILFAAVTRFSLGHATARYADCARALGCASAEEDDRVASERFADEIALLCADLQVPTPAGLGIGRADWDDAIPLMAEQALASGSPANNPRVPEQAEIEGLYAALYD